MGYSLPPEDGYDALIRRLQDAERRIAELERPTGTQTAGALAKLQNVIAGILNATNFTVPGFISAGSTISAGGDITSTGGRGVFASGLNSVGAYGTDVSLLAGARQPVWQHNSGVYGFSPSSIVKKVNLGQVPFSAEDILECTAFVYQYRGQVAIRDDPENENYDPSYVVPTEIGFMAEHLIDHGLASFVIFDGDGKPVTIDYALLGAVAAIVVGQDHAAKLKTMQAEIDRLKRLMR